MDETRAQPDWSVRQQIIEDEASGLTIQFEVMPSGERKLRLFGGALPYGNREITFDSQGREVGAGTATTGPCKPTWITQVEP